MQYGKNISNFDLKTRYSFSNGKEDEYPIIVGYASTYSLDRHNEIIAKGAFKSSYGNEIKLLWQHNYLEPIGVVKMILEDNIGLKIEAEINTKVDKGLNAVSLIKQGAISNLSIGFLTKTCEYNTNNQKVITDLDLLEVSVVTFGANEQSKISQIKAITECSKQYLDAIAKLEVLSKKLFYV